MCSCAMRRVEGRRCLGFGITGRDPGAATPGQAYGRLKLTVTNADGTSDDENFETAWPADGSPLRPNRRQPP